MELTDLKTEEVKIIQSHSVYPLTQAIQVQPFEYDNTLFIHIQLATNQPQKTTSY